MNFTVVVNDVARVLPEQSTALLAHSAARRGHPVYFASMDGLGWSDEGLRVRRRALWSSGDTAVALERCQTAPPAWACLGANDVVLVRTNPGSEVARAASHAAALSLLALARRRGVRVLNDPDALARMQSKLNTLDLPPAIRAPGIVSSNADELRSFVEAAGGRCVLKPLMGTRGNGVRLVQGCTTPPFGTPLDQALAELCTGDPVLAQAWAPGGEQGDVRVIMVDGRPLEVAGRLAAVRRIPPATDFRSNVSRGGRPAKAQWTATLERVVREAGPWLRRAGLWLVGLDIIGACVIEANVFSAGGLLDAGRLEGVDFGDAVIERIERRFETAGDFVR